MAAQKIKNLNLEKLFPLSELLELSTAFGIDFGKGNPYERIRYFIKLGLIPRAEKVFRQAADNKKILEGHFPGWIIYRLLQIQDLNRQGVTVLDIQKAVGNGKLKLVDLKTAQKNHQNTQSSSSVTPARRFGEASTLGVKAGVQLSDRLHGSRNKYGMTQVTIGDKSFWSTTFFKITYPVLVSTFVTLTLFMAFKGLVAGFGMEKLPDFLSLLKNDQQTNYQLPITNKQYNLAEPKPPSSTSLVSQLIEQGVLAEEAVSRFLEVNTPTIINGLLVGTSAYFGTSNTTGISLEGGNLDTSGNLNVGGTAEIAGNTTLSGTLDVIGQTTLSDSLVFTDSEPKLNFTDGSSFIFGDGTNTLITIKDSGNSADLTITGATTSNGDLTGKGTLKISGATTLSGALEVSGASTLTGALTASSTLKVSSATTLSSTLAVTGASTFAGAASITDTTQSSSTTTGSLIVSGGAGIAKNVYIGGDLVVTGAITGSSGSSGATTFTGQILASDGTVAAPGYSFSADTDTGLYRSGANTLDIATGGVQTGSFSTSLINIGTDANAKTINIGTGAVANTIAIGSSSTTGLSLTDNNWNITGAGAANFVSIGATTAGSGAFTTLTSSGNTTLGTASSGTHTYSTGAGSTTTLGNSTGALTVASGGTSAWTNTSGNLTISTATSGTLALSSVGALTLTGAASSTWSTSNGTLTISGDDGLILTAASTAGITGNVPDNITNAVDIQESTNNYINVNTTNSSENVAFGNATTNPSFSFLGTGAVTITGAAEGTASLTQTLGDHVITDGDLTISGGEISATTDDTTTTGFAFVANTITSGNGLTLSGTGMTTGEILDLTGTWAPTDGSDNEGIDINLTHTPTTSADTFRGLDLNVTEGANALANTLYSLKVVADNSANTSTGTHTIYGGHFTATGKTAGTTTAVGLYATAASADNNYAAIFDAGNVGIGDTTPSSALEVGNGTDSLQISSVGDMTFVDADGAASITGPAGGAFSVVAGASQALTLTGAGASTWSTSNGLLTISGDDGITLTAASTAGITGNVPDNITNAIDIQESTNNYINVNTTNSSENVAFGNATTNPSFSFLGTGAVTIAGSADGTDALVLTAGDILISNGDFDLSGGDFNVTLDAGDGVNIAKGAAPSVDVFTINGGTSATSGVDTLQLTQTISNTSGNVLDVTPTFTTNANATFNIFDLDAFTATSDDSAGTTVTGTVRGINIGNITESLGAADVVTSSALRIGTGWDDILNYNGTTVINGSGQVVSTQITGTLFSNSSDSNSGTNTIIQGDTLTISGGTNGIDTSLSNDTYTLNLDTTEIGTTTFGSGSGITWTFDAGTTDPTIAFGDGTINLTATTTTATGALTVTGNTTLGDNVADTLTIYPTTLSFLKENAHTIQIADSTTSGTAGGALSIVGAAGNGAAAGGAISLTTGAAGATSGTSGALSLTTGTAASGAQTGTTTLSTGNATAANSGALTLSTGTTTTSGTTGAISITSGNSAGTSGALTLDVGTNSGTAGTLSVGTTNARTITIGSSSATDVSITDNSWSVTAAGLATFAANVNANGGLDVDDVFVVADGGVVTANTDVDFVFASGESFTVTTTTPTVDAIAASLGTSSTDGVDGLQLTFTSSNASGNVIDITPSVTVNASETYNVIDIDAFTGTINAAGTLTLNGISVGNLTQSETTGTITGTAFNIGSGWDSDINATTSLEIAIGGTNELYLDGDDFSPAASDGNALGDTDNMWADLFLASGGVINFNNGDVTLTHGTDALTVAGGNFNADGGFDVDDVFVVADGGAVTFNTDVDFTLAGGENVVLTNASNTTAAAGLLDINGTGSTTDSRTADISTTFTSTGATTSYGLSNAWTSTTVVTGASVSQTGYGIYNTATKTGADDATGTYSLYGLYSTASNTGRTAAGTVNTYGGYFDATGDSAGTTSVFGLYLADVSGGDTNVALCFDCDGTYSASTVASGIQFGTDANAVTLYRSASDILRTGDGLTVDLDLIVSGGDITGTGDESIDIGEATTNGITFLIDATAEVLLTSSALSPSTSDGNALGTSSLMWADLFLASGAVVNFNNGDVTLTHASDALTIAGGAVTITGAAEGTASLTQTAGDHVITDGDLTISGGEISATTDDTSTTGFAFVANTITSGNGLTLSGTGMTTGEILDLTGTWAPTDGSTNEAIDLNITHTPTSSADNFQSINLTTTDGTALANTVYNIQGTLTLTGNAAKTGIGDYQTVTTSSTTADTLVAFDAATSATGIIGSGTRANYGVRTQPVSTSANTGGTQNMYGIYSAPSSTLAAGSTENVYGGYFKATGTVASGTVTSYGVNIANPTMNTTGTSTKIGLHLEDLATTGPADSNYGVCFDCDGTYSSSTAANGITWGSDANQVTLYRSASDTLKTDDSMLVAGTLLTVTGVEGSNGLVLTAGDAAISDGSLSVTDDDNATSFSLTNNTATTVGAGVNTDGVADISSTSLTTGNLLNLETTTALTSGRVLNVSSTTTSSSFSGNLGRFEWLPGSATTATADLFLITIGANGTTTGDLFDIQDAGTSLFQVSETTFTTSLPSNFTAAGDVSIAYDINMTNPTASFIKSAAPLAIVAGEVFNSSNLTLQTYNSGNVVVDLPATGYMLVDGAFSIGAQQTLTANSTTPSVAAGSHFITANTTDPTLISNFTSGYNGQILAIEFGDSVTDLDCSSSSLNCGGTDVTAIASGDVAYFIYDGTNWNLIEYLDVTSNSQAAGADLAEYFVSTEGLEPGDVVSIDPTQAIKIHKSTGAQDQKAIGIIATNPGITLGENTGLDAYAVGLAGRVPAKVSIENGAIEVGDYLTSSSTPGVAMKATRPGPVIGKALESFSGSGTGMIMVFVNISFADPNNYLANISFDDNGNVVLSQLSSEKILIDAGINLNSSDLKTYLTYQTVSSGSDINYSINVAESLNDISDKLVALDQSDEDQTNESAVLAEQIAETKSTTLTLAQQLASAAASLAQTQSDVEDLKLTPPDTLYATSSAQFADLTVTSEATFSGKLASYDLSVSNIFKSLGQAILGNTTVAGSITQDGTLSISEGNSINVIGDPDCVILSDSEGSNCGVLYLQKNILASKLDILDGLFIFDQSGKLTVTGEVLANQFSVKSGESVGVGTILAGQTALIIENEYVQDDSVILLTAHNPLGQSLAVTEKTTGGFAVELSVPELTDVTFDYLVIGVTE